MGSMGRMDYVYITLCIGRVLNWLRVCMGRIEYMHIRLCIGRVLNQLRGCMGRMEYVHINYVLVECSASWSMHTAFWGMRNYQYETMLQIKCRKAVETYMNSA